MSKKFFESIMQGLKEVADFILTDTTLEQDLKWADEIKKLGEDWENPNAIAKALKILKETGTDLYWFSLEDPNCLEEEENENTLREIVKILKHHVKFTQGGKIPIQFEYAFVVTSDDETKIMFTDIPNLDKYIVLED